MSCRSAVDAPQRHGPGGDLLHVHFNEISGYSVELPNPFLDEDEIPEDERIPPLDDQVPKNVKALNNVNVQIEGYVFPIEVKDSKATEYLLMRVPLSCCFAE